jgi:uncharacterized repeat protein (TIGR01451 family)
VVFVAVVVVVLLAGFAARAGAASPAPSWSVQSNLNGTFFAPGSVSEYDVVATNVGTGPAGDVTLTDRLPPAVSYDSSVAFYWSGDGKEGAGVGKTDLTKYLPELGVSCTAPSAREVKCSFPASASGHSIPPGGTVAMLVRVSVSPSAPEEPISNEAVVEGAGKAASATAQDPVRSQMPFGVAAFQMTSCADGSGNRGFACDAPYTQAGGTPYELTTKVQLNSQATEESGVGSPLNIAAGGDVRDVAVDLPPGLIVDPQATRTCPVAVFADEHQSCPATSQVGTAMLDLFGSIKQYPLYNLTPQEGHPAQFGIPHVGGNDYVISGSVRTGEDYGLSAISSGTPSAARLTAATISLWGVPADPSHDPQRGQYCEWYLGAPPPALPSACEGGGLPSGEQPVALVRLPTQCSGLPLVGVGAADSWEDPGRLNPDGSRAHGDPTWSTATATLPALTGCGSLSFSSSLEVQPDNTLVGEPVGLGVSLGVPQTQDPALTAVPAVRDVRVSLPMGMVVSPSAAQGLTTCRDDPGANPLVEANELGPSSISPASCDASSQVGTVRVTTPDLALPLEGKVFLGSPLCGPCGPGDAQGGRMVRLYLQLIGEGSDALTVKLVGYGSIDQQTGQLTTTFPDNPQLPFEKLKLELGGGPRAPLANPRVCGPAVTQGDFTPWSSPFTPDALPFSEFVVSGCEGSRFAPSFTAGTTSNQAGGFSPFTLAFGRSDADGFLSGVQTTMPPGLLGMLSNVSLCGEPQAAQGTCGDESLIGHTQVLTGPGAEPFLVTGGKVFITGPYKGAPYGLSIVVPAKAGPYTLTGTTGTGTVVVRAAINVDPVTAQLVVTADALPTVLDGIPLQLRVVNVTIDRPGFTFNPTNCNPLAITGTLSSSEGQSAQVSSSFQVTNCAALAFKPRFTVSTSARTSKANGASLDAKVSYPAGSQGAEANIARVKVDLPRQLPSRLTTLQKACTAAQFETDPGGCPAASIVGIARAMTPVLPAGLSGPVYFVSHGGEAFPSLIVVLQGDGVRVDLTGSTFISKAGITSSTFKTVPDVPVSSFELFLPEGKYSALAANGNLCAAQGKLKMPTEFVAQNGTVIHQSTVIAVTGCPKAKKVAHKARKARKARKAGHGSTDHRRAKR